MPIMQAGCGVLIPPLVASHNHAGVGDTSTVTDKNGPVTCMVAGIGSSFVLASIISNAVVDQFAADQPFSLYLTHKLGVDAAQLEKDVQALGGKLSLEVMTINEFAGTLTSDF